MKCWLTVVIAFLASGNAIAHPFDLVETKIGGQSYQCAKGHPGICFKDRWVFVTRDDKVHYLLDMETAAANRSWVKTNIHRDDSVSFLQLYETDCKNMSLRVTEEFIYTEPDQKGKLFHHGNPMNKDDAQWRTPAPNTILDTILRTICAFRRSAKN